MKKEEIAINDKFGEIYLDGIDQSYKSVYSAVDSPKTYLEKLNTIFAFYNQELFLLFKELNHRIETSKYFTAQNSRDLISLTSNIRNLQKNLKGTNLYFTIIQLYDSYLTKMEPILKSSNGTQLPPDLEEIQIKEYEKVFILTKKQKTYVASNNDDINKILKLVSVRNNDFESMETDEKLCNLNIAVEYMLFHKDKYENIDYTTIFSDLLDESNIKAFRKITNCFRHGKEKSIEERNEFAEEQKIFMINYGLSICMAIQKHKLERK